MHDKQLDGNPVGKHLIVCVLLSGVFDRRSPQQRKPFWGGPRSSISIYQKQLPNKWRTECQGPSKTKSGSA